MADKTPIMSVEEYRALKKAGKLEQALSERYGLIQSFSPHWPLGASCPPWCWVSSQLKR